MSGMHDVDGLERESIARPRSHSWPIPSRQSWAKNEAYSPGALRFFCTSWIWKVKRSGSLGSTPRSEPVGVGVTERLDAGEVLEMDAPLN